jgi:hypothetical protein
MRAQPPSRRAIISWLLIVFLTTGLARSLAATNQDFVGTIDFEQASTAGQITLQIQTSVPPVAEGWLFVTENGSGAVSSWTCPEGWAVSDSDTTKSSTHAPFVLCHKTMEDGDPGTNYVVYNNLTTGSNLYGVAFATTPGSTLDTVGETWNVSTTSPVDPGLIPSSAYDLLVSLIFTGGAATFATSPTPYPTPLQQNNGAYILSAQPGTIGTVGPWTAILSSALGVTGAAVTLALQPAVSGSPTPTPPPPAVTPTPQAGTPTPGSLQSITITAPTPQATTSTSIAYTLPASVAGNVGVLCMTTGQHMHSVSISGTNASLWTLLQSQTTASAGPEMACWSRNLNASDNGVTLTMAAGTASANYSASLVLAAGSGTDGTAGIDSSAMAYNSSSTSAPIPSSSLALTHANDYILAIVGGNLQVSSVASGLSAIVNNTGAQRQYLEYLTSPPDQPKAAGSFANWTDTLTSAAASTTFVVAFYPGPALYTAGYVDTSTIVNEGTSSYTSCSHFGGQTSPVAGNCYHAMVRGLTGENVDDMYVFWDVTPPVGGMTSTTPDMLIFNGSGGTALFGEGDSTDVANFAYTYTEGAETPSVQMRVIQIGWATNITCPSNNCPPDGLNNTNWTVGSGNGWMYASQATPTPVPGTNTIRYSAGRIAAIVNFLYSSTDSTYGHNSSITAPFCATAISNGTAQVMHDLGHYGGGYYFDFVSLLDNSPEGAMDIGCNSAGTIDSCSIAHDGYEVSGIYTIGPNGYPSKWDYDEPNCSATPSPTALGVWNQDSLSAPDFMYYYPQTAIADYQCPIYNEVPGLGAFYIPYLSPMGGAEVDHACGNQGDQHGATPVSNGSCIGERFFDTTDSGGNLVKDPTAWNLVVNDAATYCGANH